MYSPFQNTRVRNEWVTGDLHIAGRRPTLDVPKKP